MYQLLTNGQLLQHSFGASDQGYKQFLLTVLTSSCYILLHFISKAVQTNECRDSATILGKMQKNSGLAIATLNSQCLLSFDRTYWVNRTNIFLGQPPKGIEIKAKINWIEWSFCTEKETINKMKRQSMNQEKIFANDATDMSLISKYAHSSTTQQQQQKNPIQKHTENLSRHFSKEDKQMTRKNMKRCSTLLIIRETKI